MIPTFYMKDLIYTSFRVHTTTILFSGLKTSILFSGLFSHFFIDEAGQATEAEILIPLAGPLGPNGKVLSSTNRFV